MALSLPSTGDASLDELLMAADPESVAARLLVQAFTTKDSVLPFVTQLGVFRAVAGLAGGEYKGRWRRSALTRGVEAVATQSLALWERCLLAGRPSSAGATFMTPVYLLQRGYQVLGDAEPTSAATAVLRLP